MSSPEKIIEGYGNDNPGAFQSTRPQEARRPGKIVILTPILYFNPHARKGRDVFQGIISAIENISIHAPHAGCDDELIADTQNGIISIHAPHAGRDIAGQKLG